MLGCCVRRYDGIGATRLEDSKGLPESVTFKTVLTRVGVSGFRAGIKVILATRIIDRKTSTAEI